MRPERVLALDVARQTVRGIVLTTGTPATAGGYAQLDFDPATGPVAFAVRIALALDVKAALPVAVTCDASIGETVAQQIATAISESGFRTVTVVARTEAEILPASGAGTAETLDGVDIPSGLLTSHAGLALTDIAAVVSAGLRLLDTDLDTITGVVDVDDAWSPASNAPPVSDKDPFTAGASSSSMPAASESFEPDDIDGDATVNSDAMPATALAAAAAVAEDNIDETVMMDRAALRPAVVSDNGGVDEVATSASADPENSGRRTVLLVGAVIALVALIGLALAQCGGSDSDTDDQVESTANSAPDNATDNATDSATDADNTAPPLTPAQTETDQTETDQTEIQPEAAPDPTVLPEPTAVPTAIPEPTATPEPEPTVDPLAGLPPLSTLPERGAIFRPPTLFLEGPVQTQEQADELYERAIAVVGPDNVVNNYVVRPDAPASLDGNVRVEQAVLFQTGSAAIADQFVPTLDLGVVVMALNPQVQMVVEGHTDSVGSEALNVALSQRRAEAVVEYLVSRGIDRERLEAVGLGETSPVADNDTADGRQINRRIEVNLLDLLAAE